MRTELSVTRVRLVLVGMALALAAAAGFLIGVFSELKGRPHLNTPRPQGIVPLNVTELAGLFSSSKASMILKATACKEQTMGQIRWASVHNSQPAALVEDERWIRVHESGLYLLFFQAVYQLSAAAAGPGNGTLALEFRVLLRCQEQEPRQSTVEFSSAFHTHCWGSREADVTLSQSVLLQAEAGDHIAVNASHRHLMDYHANPLSSFLTLLKFSDADH
ncbi:hypothetical protein COCON_G00167000 [Conger conger]|uniref:THD domain-containing protein n=2 Tax=Conger conger TaxID=82655 RepID=A0A9Q1D6Z6_CONCO|nr:hypothetical protein COCON_G00167000 [Conger conger]